MSITPQELARRVFHREWERLTSYEQRVLDAFVRRAPVSRDPIAAEADDRTFGQRTADSIAAFGGSWPFVLIFLGTLIGWILLNAAILRKPEAFDPYPFILLNLFLSMLAALQAPIIMMSQNRQTLRDRADATHDYEVNLKAELEIRALHDKLDALREAQWAELVRMQQEQLRILERLIEAGHGGPSALPDAR